MTNTIIAVIAIIARIETGGHPDPVNAIGDGGRAVGVLQMHPKAVEEANRIRALQGRSGGMQGRLWDARDRASAAESVCMAFTILEFHYRRGTTDPVGLATKWKTPYGAACPKYRNKVIRVMRETGYGQ